MNTGFPDPTTGYFWLNLAGPAPGTPSTTRRPTPPMRQHRVQHVTIHGHRRAYVKAGKGPTLLLLHGLGCTHRTWLPVLDSLARRYTVIAPDLLGHGESDKPRADYSIGAFANGMRDLLTVLGIDKVTVVGHSFGGGVAMQFAYQFPERTERLVLVGSGGLGPEVSAGDPGDHHHGLLPGDGRAHHARRTPRRHRRPQGRSRAPGSRSSATSTRSPRSTESFRDPAASAAIRHVVRAVVDWQGQIVTMADRAYLAEAMPMCVIWGDQDRVIPVSHATAPPSWLRRLGSRSSRMRATSRTRTTPSGS